jgi:hypothetical protein
VWVLVVWVQALWARPVLANRPSLVPILAARGQCKEAVAVLARQGAVIHQKPDHYREQQDQCKIQSLELLVLPQD